MVQDRLLLEEVETAEEEKSDRLREVLSDAVEKKEMRIFNEECRRMIRDGRLIIHCKGLFDDIFAFVNEIY